MPLAGVTCLSIPGTAVLTRGIGVLGTAGSAAGMVEAVPAAEACCWGIVVTADAACWGAVKPCKYRKHSKEGIMQPQASAALHVGHEELHYDVST